jgi:long-chain fatty acid transport protein
LGILVVAGISLAVAAMANGFRNPPEGAAALGHSGGKLILTDDASAAVHNPANLTQHTNAQVVVSMTTVNTETEFSSPAGSTCTEDSWKYLPNIFASVPFENSDYVLGMALNTPFGQSTVWDDAGPLSYAWPYFAEMKLLNVNPTLAAKINESLSVAAGLDVYWSQLDIKQKVPWARLTGNPASPDGVMHLQGQGQGVGGNAALTYRPAKGHAVALTYRSPVKVDYDGDCEISEFPNGAEAMGLSSSSDFETSIEFPTVIGLGYALDVSKSVRVEADVEWVEFSRYDTLTLDAGNNNALLNQPGAGDPGAPVAVREDWNDTWTFGLGADWAVCPEMTLRAGYIYLQSPVPDETLAPTLPDADRHVVTVGVGLHRGRQSIDLAYGYSFIADRDVDHNQNPAYDGTYDTTAHLMSISYGYAF